MSNETPKKIWVIRDKYVVDPEKTCERIVPYIRADLVDGLVFALNECLRVNGYQNAREMIHAALKALEEE